jgi:catechol 2,3-dioxygenase-like lactoylglutathione lyase family enzyme
MLSHVHVGVTDFERAFAFYAALMEELGFPLRFRELERPWAGWMSRDRKRPLFLIGRPFDGAAPSAGNGQMVAFLALSREMVDRCYACAIAAGAQSEGEPGLRPEYHEHYYGAYFRDLDGNKVCVACHEPAESAHDRPSI